MFEHAVAHLEGEVADAFEIFVGLGGESDHVIELQVLDAAREDQVGAIQDLFVGNGLVDHAAQAIGSRFRRDGQRAFSALAQQPDDRFGEIVEAE